VKFRHYLSIVLALAVLAGVAGTVYFSGSSAFGDMEVIGRGDVAIHRGNSVIPVGSSPEALEPQDVVVTGRKSVAKLKLEDGRTISLQDKTRLRIRSTDAVEPQAGSILAISEEAPTEVLFDDVTARFSSAMFRVDRGFGSARAAVLEGSARLESAGEPRVELTRLKQVEVAAGDLPRNDVPYRLNAADPFDIQHLDAVLTLDEQLDSLVTGFLPQIGSSRPGLSYFSDLANANVNFMSPYLSRPVPHLLVGFTIADNDPDASLKSSFRQALQYLGEGASYGVAAALLEVKAAPLVAQLESMIVGTGAVATDGGAGDATFGDGGGLTATGPGENAPVLATDDEETVSGAVEGETSGEVDDCSNVVDCGVQDVQDEIPPGPGPNTGPEGEDPPPKTVPGSDLLSGSGLLGTK